jgi:hypothetical protein
MTLVSGFKDSGVKLKAQDSGLTSQHWSLEYRV